MVDIEMSNVLLKISRNGRCVDVLALGVITIKELLSNVVEEYLIFENFLNCSFCRVSIIAIFKFNELNCKAWI